MLNKIFPTVRIKQFLDNPMYLYTWVIRQFFYKKDSFRYVDKYKNITQLDEDQSLREIICKNKSIIRFGDGEFGLLTGAGVYCGIRGFLKFNWSQRYSRKLKRELIRILRSKKDNIMIAFPPLWHIMHDDKKGQLYSGKELIHTNMHLEARMLLWKYLDTKHVYGSWSVFMPQHNLNLDWNLISSYIQDKNIIIITGNTHNLKKISLGKKTFFVECGTNNAFEKRSQICTDIHDLIEREGLRKGESLCLISLGPTAAFIVEYISELGFVAWDTGHLFQYAEKEIEKIKSV